MKKITLVLFASLFSLSAWSYNMVACDGITMPNSSLLLVVDNEQLLQARIQTSASTHPRALVTNLISSNQDSSFFSVAGSSVLLEVENSVLRLEGGLLNLGDKRFVCGAN